MPPRPSKLAHEVAAVKARDTLARKSSRTPLEDALAQGNGGALTVELVRFARSQRDTYHSNLDTWRANRRRYAQEAADVFEHRRTDRGSEDSDDPKVIFQIQNGSLNFVAGLAEFASAQAEQDIFGGEPWFAATPVGLNDQKLADIIQKHLQWTFRDGSLVNEYCEGITVGAALGETFTKTGYEIEADTFEEEVQVLHADGKPIKTKGNFITSEEQAQGLKLKGKLSWSPVFVKRQTVLKHGVVTSVLNHNDIAFREDAPKLDLRHTNFYNIIELPVTEAMSKFNLSKADALRLAVLADASTGKAKEERHKTADTPGDGSHSKEEEFTYAETERLMNVRVRLIEGWMAIDPFGDGKTRRLYVVFPPQAEDWLVYGDYLANLSPKSELPIKVHPWEKVPGKLYGRGFFAKYGALQTYVDDLWNQVSFRNRMHANPFGAYRPERLERDEDDADLKVTPGLMLKIKGDYTLAQVLEFAEMPDLDNRSMELMQIAIQMAQLRSGITSASQGDLSSVPENNTATGIRSLMSRAAVLLKKPVRGLRRSYGAEFSYAVKLHYGNFDRNEAFVWGEGQKTELLELKAEQIADLDIDVRLLLTQEQNQTKLEGAQQATATLKEWLAVPEIEKGAARPLFVQSLKALEFDQAEQIIRQPMPTLEDAALLLPPDQQQRLAMLLQMEAQIPAAPPTPTTPPTL